MCVGGLFCFLRKEAKGTFAEVGRCLVSKVPDEFGSPAPLSTHRKWDKAVRPQ